MRLFIESDFAGAGRTMRLRHAFLQTNRFVVGQTWSTFSDPEADPIGIDFEGLNAISRFRQPVFRWTPSDTDSRYQWALALENPAPDLTGAQGVNFSPDFIARLKFQPGRKRGLALFTDQSRRQWWSGNCAAKCRTTRGQTRNGWDRRVSAESSCRDGMRTTESSLRSTPDPGSTLHR